MKKLHVKAVERNKKGEYVLNLAADEANADWIRALRLLKEGKKEELKVLENSHMYYLVGEQEIDIILEQRPPTNAKNP